MSTRRTPGILTPGRDPLRDHALGVWELKLANQVRHRLSAPVNNGFQGQSVKRRDGDRGPLTRWHCALYLTLIYPSMIGGSGFWGAYPKSNGVPKIYETGKKKSKKSKKYMCIKVRAVNARHTCFHSESTLSKIMYTHKSHGEIPTHIRTNQANNATRGL